MLYFHPFAKVFTRETFQLYSIVIGCMLPMCKHENPKLHGSLSYKIKMHESTYRLDVESRDLRDFKASGPGL